MFKHPTRHGASASSGFTLVELLVVMSVLAILATMTMPIITIAQRAAKRSASQSVMHKVDAAVTLFRLEIGAFPYQQTYADLDTGDRPTNRLAYHLGGSISIAAHQDLLADAADAEAQFAFDCTPPGGNGDAVEPTGAPQRGPLAFRSSDIKPAASASLAWSNKTGVWTMNADSTSSRAKLATALVLNRMARERARLAIFSGNIDLTGCVMTDAYDPNGIRVVVGRDLSASKVLTNPRSAAQPGWAGDYLAGEIERRYIDGDTILDAYRQPLVYVCQVEEGMRSRGGLIFDARVLQIDSEAYGLARKGRRSLAARDPQSGILLSADPVALPDPSNRLHSDRRVYAAPGHEVTPELWSLGGDGRGSWMRDDLRNRDNVPLLPYDRELRQ